MLLPTAAFAAQLPEQTQEILRTAPDIAQVSGWTLDGLWAAALRGLGLGLLAVGLAGLLFRLAGLPRRLFVLFHRRFPL